MTIDFHSHILCGVDHGSDSSQTSKRQLELMAKSKTDLVVATSHFYPEQDSIADFLCVVDRAIEKIKEAEISRAPELCIGAEVPIM